MKVYDINKIRRKDSIEEIDEKYDILRKYSISPIVESEQEQQVLDAEALIPGQHPKQQ